MLGSLLAVTRLVGLTPLQTFDIARISASKGGVGAPLYDTLIGHAEPRTTSHAARASLRAIALDGLGLTAPES